MRVNLLAKSWFNFWNETKSLAGEKEYIQKAKHPLTHWYFITAKKEL